MFLNHWEAVQHKRNTQASIDLTKSDVAEINTNLNFSMEHDPTIDGKNNHEIDIDAFIIGSRGLNSFKKSFLETRSKKLKCPVMIVNEQ
jgi:hypothetical protein